MSETGAPAPSLEETIARALAARSRWSLLEVLFWLAAAACLFLPANYQPLLAEMAIFGLFALSLDLIVGYAGIVSLGHVAYFGIGVLVAGVMTNYWTAEPMRGLLAAGLAAAFIGFLASFPIARATSIVRVAMTIVIALALREAALLLGYGSGGPGDIRDVIVGPILGKVDLALSGGGAFAYSLAVLFVLFLVARQLGNSNFGSSLRLIKADSSRAAMRGISLRRLVAIHTVAAAYAGVAGALLAQTAMFVPPDIWSFERSIYVLLALVIGGTGYLYGGLIGAALFVFVQVWISSLVTPPEWILGVGVALVLVAMVRRANVADWLRVRFPLSDGRAPQRSSAGASAGSVPGEG